VTLWCADGRVVLEEEPGVSQELLIEPYVSQDATNLHLLHLVVAQIRQLHLARLNLRGEELLGQSDDVGASDDLDTPVDR